MDPIGTAGTGGITAAVLQRVFLSHTSDLGNHTEPGSFVAAAVDAVLRARHAVTDMAYSPRAYYLQRVDRSRAASGTVGSTLPGGQGSDPRRPSRARPRHPRARPRPRPPRHHHDQTCPGRSSRRRATGRPRAADRADQVSPRRRCCIADGFTAGSTLQPDSRRQSIRQRHAAVPKYRIDGRARSSRCQGRSLPRPMAQ